nr:MAG TPA: hypothetical protein [Caudoviricetes sp.]DAQ62446.1 MAG TPA: hypothetical protein [Caudoviricetes sp.]
MIFSTICGIDYFHNGRIGRFCRFVRFFICRTSVFCSGGLVSDQVSGCGRNFCFRCFHCFLKRGVVFYDALFSYA